MLILFTIYFGINVGCLGFLVYNTIANGLDLKEELMMGVIIVSAFIFLGITFIVALYFFIREYLIDKVTRLESYQKHNPHHVRSKSNMNRVHPLPSS